MATASSPYLLCDQYGRSLFPARADRPGKYRNFANLKREIRESISQRDYGQMVSDCANICARIPALSGAIRQKNEWAFPPDSWQPIFYHEYNDKDKWSDEAEDWLVHTVFPNALLGNTRKDLIRSIAVSGMDADRHGRDLAIFRCDASTDFLPKMQIVPGPRIGNGGTKGTWWTSKTVTSVGGGSTGASGSGYDVCVGGEFDGYRIYQGIDRKSVV